ncbi:MAG: PIN domain-containing protein [Gammaproteobacteria bacterium]|nr:PIN domain-containing protein [Gammaproteobacteria bacterium]
MVDTNVVLDLLLAREPFVQSAATIFALTERSELESYLCATTVTTIDYLLSKVLEKSDAHAALQRLLELFEIAPVNRPVIEEAIKSRIQDFEDAVIEQAAYLVGAQAIVSRDTKGFKYSVVKCLDPQELLAFLNVG